MSIILTTQTPPTGSGLQFEYSVDTAPPGSTSPTDTISFVQSVSTKWLVTIIQNDRVRFFEVAASCHLTHDPRWTVFGDVGDRINVKPIVTKVPGQITLSVINNEVTPVDVNIARIHSFAK